MSAPTTGVIVWLFLAVVGIACLWHFAKTFPDFMRGCLRDEESAEPAPTRTETRCARNVKDAFATRMLNREPSCLHWFKRGDKREKGRPMWEGTGRARGAK